MEVLRAENALLRRRVAELEAMLPLPAAGQNAEEQRLLESVAAAVDANLRSEAFSVDSLCESLAMSHSSLYKRLKALTGLSVMEYVTERRILKARQCFADGMASVAAVAELCGYKDIKTFRAAFRRLTGLSPKQFQRQRPQSLVRQEPK